VRLRERLQEKQRSEERRRLWLKAISRDNFTASKIKYQKVCWKHFISGRAAASWNIHSPDWLPTLQLGHVKYDSTLPGQKARQRSERALLRRKRIEMIRERNSTAGIEDRNSAVPLEHHNEVEPVPTTTSDFALRTSSCSAVKSANIQTDLTIDLTIVSCELVSARHRILECMMFCL